MYNFLTLNLEVCRETARLLKVNTDLPVILSCVLTLQESYDPLNMHAVNLKHTLRELEVFLDNFSRSKVVAAIPFQYFT
jgi:hypothetical protein